MNAGLTLPTASKPRPASRSCSAPPARIAPQDAQPRAAVAEEEHALAVEARLAKGDGREGGRGVVEPALLHQRVGEKGRRVPVEAGRLPPGSAQGERLSSLGLRLEQVATPHEHEQAEDLGGGEGEGRPTPARLGERVFEDHQRLVEVRHRQDHDGRDEEGAGDVVPHERPLAKRSTRDRHDLRCRLAGAGIVVREQGEQHLFPEGLRGRSFSDGLEQLEGVVVQGRREQVVGDQPGLEQALELGVGAVEVGQRLR